MAEQTQLLGLPSHPVTLRFAARLKASQTNPGIRIAVRRRGLVLKTHVDRTHGSSIDIFGRITNGLLYVKQCSCKTDASDGSRIEQSICRIAAHGRPLSLCETPACDGCFESAYANRGN